MYFMCRFSDDQKIQNKSTHSADCCLSVRFQIKKLIFNFFWSFERTFGVIKEKRDSALKLYSLLIHI